MRTLSDDDLTILDLKGRINGLEIIGKRLEADAKRLHSRNMEAARILMAVRTVFGPVTYSDDAEGETWAKIDDWLTIKHDASCAFVKFDRQAQCDCSQTGKETSP